MTTAKLLKLCAQIRDDFCERLLDTTEVVFRCDNASPHAGAADNEALKKLGVSLYMHPKTSASKNSIAELDGRCSKINKYIKLFMAEPGADRESVARKAAKNTTTYGEQKVGLRQRFFSQLCN